MIDRMTAAERPRWSVVAALMTAMFTITVGYGVVLPILPFSLERLAANSDPAAVSRDTGLLSATYVIALLVFAPLWGRLSDRLGRRPLILLGLVGFALTLALFGLANHLALLYVTRFFNGFFASAVTPAAYALIGDFALSRAERAHRFALLNIGATAGFVMGPLIGGLIPQDTHSFAPWLAATGVPEPLLATAALALLDAPLVWCLLPNVLRRPAVATATPRENRRTRTRLFAIAIVTTTAVGAFEVGLSLRGKAVGLDAARIGMMFMECSLVMFVAQGVVFSPLVNPEATRWFFAPGMVALAIGLVAVPLVTGYLPLVIAVSLIAASAGILSPIVTYWISLGAEERQGAALGLATAAASLGQAVGSAMGGLLFNVAILPGASFIVSAAIVLAALVATSGLPSLLVRPLQIEPRPAKRMAKDSF